MASQTYSFKDCQATIDGPGGSVALAGDEAGIASEGITIEASGDINTMTSGADGAVMHSLSADRSGTVTVRLQQTSAVNRQLQVMQDYQAATSARHGKNTITIRDTARGDTVTCTGVAFAKYPSLTYAAAAGNREWVFHAARIERQIGSGTPEI